MIGVLTYFLEFQIEQSERGISIKKERYVKDLLRKYDKIGSSVNTLIVPPNMLGPDLNGKVASSKHKESDLISVKRIIRYLKAMFLAEAEDIAAAGCCANILWIKSQLTNYDIIYEKLLDKPSFKRLIDELGMLNIDSKPEASVLTEEN
ncbi:hypothetical protein Tco_0134890 [Tanacetum coccineum]